MLGSHEMRGLIPFSPGILFSLPKNPAGLLIYLKFINNGVPPSYSPTPDYAVLMYCQWMPLYSGGALLRCAHAAAR